MLGLAASFRILEAVWYRLIAFKSRFACITARPLLRPEYCNLSGVCIYVENGGMRHQFNTESVS